MFFEKSTTVRLKSYEFFEKMLNRLIIFGLLAFTITFSSITVFEEAFATKYELGFSEGSGDPGCESTNSCYSTYNLKIKSGDSVMWYNLDSAPHTVTSGTPEDGPDGIFDSSLLMPSAFYTFDFNSAGRYDYFCMVHPWMTGIITVESTSPSVSSSINTPVTTFAQTDSLNIVNFFPSPAEIDTSKSGISPEWKAQPIYDMKKDYEDIDGLLQLKGRVYTNNESWIVNEIAVIIGEFSSRQNAQVFYESVRDFSIEEIQNDLGVEDLTVKTFIISEEECTKINFWKRYDWHNEIYCIRDNYVIAINAPENMSSDAEELLTKILSKFPPSQKLLEKQRLEQEKLLEQKKMLNGGEMLIVESVDKTELIDLVLLEKNNMDLLKINFVKEFNEPNSYLSYPFGSLSINDEFTNEYEQWMYYQFLTTEDVNVFGNTIKGSDDWDTDCPSYLGRTFNPNIPYEFIACFEIPKNVNYFKFEGVVFTKADISSGDKSIFQNTSDSQSSSNGGGCLIATATFDSELAPQVQKLREIRDSKLLQTESGTGFMESFNSFYYSFSPIIADYERENPVFKEIVKIGITPMLSTLSLMDYADTESEVLGIGISLIILNGIMYVGLPVFGIIIAKKR